MTTKDMRLDAIRVDSELQPRVEGLDEGHIRSLQETPEDWPPLTVTLVADHPVLIDGRHRLAAAQRLGLHEVPVRLVNAPEDGDLRALAFALNLAHGRPLSLCDRKTEAARLLRVLPALADREIARRCALAGNTVGTIRHRLEETAQIEQLTSRRGADNKTRPVSISTKPGAPGSAPAPTRKPAGRNGRAMKQAAANRAEPAFAALQDFVDRLMTYTDNHASDGLDEAFAMAVAGHWPSSEWSEIAEVLTNSGAAFLSAADLLRQRLQPLSIEAVRAKEPPRCPRLSASSPSHRRISSNRPALSTPSISLWRSTMASMFRSVSLAQIIVDPGLQPRVDGLDDGHVRALQDAPDGWPPIAVVTKDGGYVLVDGFHRYAAAQNLGLGEIPADVLPMPADGNLHALAFSLNAMHGRPLTLTDRRAFAARLLAERPETSNMEVSRRTGLSPSTITMIRERLEATNEIASVSERIGANGVRYPALQTTPVRQAGELPTLGLTSMVGNALGKLISTGERAQQRKIVQYLERLAVALEDQESLDGWDTAAQAAEACALVLGEGRATQLGERLGWTSRNVLDVAYALGFTDEDDAA